MERARRVVDDVGRPEPDGNGRSMRRGWVSDKKEWVGPLALQARLWRLEEAVGWRAQQV